MATDGTTDAASERTLKKTVWASLIGTTIEWYDFYIYGTAAALVFNKLFFPKEDPLTGTMIAFGTYAPPSRPASATSTSSAICTSTRTATRSWWSTITTIATTCGASASPTPSTCMTSRWYGPRATPYMT